METMAGTGQVFFLCGSGILYLADQSGQLIHHDVHLFRLGIHLFGGRGRFFGVIGVPERFWDAILTFGSSANKKT